MVQVGAGVSESPFLMGELADLLDPRLVIAHDLAYTRYDTKPAKPLPRKRRAKNAEPPTHICIPDMQIKPGVDTRHLDWIGSFIADEFADHENVVLIVGGDWWDMPSLSQYDRGKKEMEGRRFIGDVAAGNEAFARFSAYLPRKKSWEYHFLFGNHEDRITRAASENAQLDGLLSLDLLDTKHFERHAFKEILVRHGVHYSHFFYAENTGRPYSGSNLETRIKQVMVSFTMFHQQGLKWGRVNTIAGPRIGLVAGSAYLHDEDYRGPQAQDHWRGIVVCRQVEDGDYDVQPISLDYLCRIYEGIRLTEYLERTNG